MNWTPLTTKDQIDSIIESSKEKTQIIFKHSTTCGISLQSRHGLETDWDFTEEEIDFHYLDLLNFRDISNSEAEKTGVLHQSPQIIVLKNEKVIYTSTHYAIQVKKIKEHI